MKIVGILTHGFDVRKLLLKSHDLVLLIEQHSKPRDSELTEDLRLSAQAHKCGKSRVATPIFFHYIFRGYLAVVSVFGAACYVRNFASLLGTVGSIEFVAPSVPLKFGSSADPLCKLRTDAAADNRSGIISSADRLSCVPLSACTGGPDVVMMVFDFTIE